MMAVPQDQINQIIGVQWRTGAVKFPGGEGTTDCIECASAVAVDSSLISLSGWFVPPSGASSITLFNAQPSDLAKQSFFLTFINSFGGNTFGFGSNVGFSNPGAQWLTDAALGSIPTGEWCHVLLVLDAGHGAGVPKIGKCYVNLVNRMSSTAPPAGDDDPGQPAGSERAYEFAINGATVGVPDTLAETAFDPPPAIAMADVRVWVGQFIDPEVTGTLDKFVRVTDDTVKIGKPAAASLAESAYGKPTFRFSGGKSAFPKNKGTGGLFDLKGVIENYTPEPSFTVT